MNIIDYIFQIITTILSKMTEMLLLFIGFALNILDRGIRFGKLFVYHSLICVRNARKLFDMLIRGTHTWILMLCRLIIFTCVLGPGFYNLTMYWLFDPLILRNVSYGKGSKYRNLLDIYLPTITNDDKIINPDGAPVVVFVSGGAWIIGYKLWSSLVGRGLARLGILTIVPDYRNFPQGDIQDMMTDITAAVNWTSRHARRFGGNPNKIILAGQSAGSHICLCILVQEYLYSKLFTNNKLEASPSSSLKESEFIFNNDNNDNPSIDDNTDAFPELNLRPLSTIPGYPHASSPSTKSNWYSPLKEEDKDINASTSFYISNGSKNQSLDQIESTEVSDDNENSDSHETGTLSRSSESTLDNYPISTTLHATSYEPQLEETPIKPPFHPTSKPPVNPSPNNTKQTSANRDAEPITSKIKMFIGISGPYNLYSLQSHLHGRGLDASILSWICAGDLCRYSPSIQLYNYATYGHFLTDQSTASDRDYNFESAQFLLKQRAAFLSEKKHEDPSAAATSASNMQSLSLSSIANYMIKSAYDIFTVDLEEEYDTATKIDVAPVLPSYLSQEHLDEHETSSRNQILKDFLPIALFHGSKDKSIPVSISNELARVLKSYGANVSYQVYENWTHTDAILEAPLSGNDRMFHDMIKLIDTVNDEGISTTSMNIIDSERENKCLGEREAPTSEVRRRRSRSNSMFLLKQLHSWGLIDAHHIEPAFSFPTDHMSSSQPMQQTNQSHLSKDNALAPKILVKIGRAINPF